MSVFRLLVLAFLLPALAGCSYQAAIVLDVGTALDSSSSRDVYFAVETFLEQMGFAREPVGKPYASESLPRSEDARFIISSFVDPESPAQPPKGWFVEVLLTKKSNLVQVIFVQPGALEPSMQLATRSDDVLEELRKVMPSIPIQKGAAEQWRSTIRAMLAGSALGSYVAARS